MIKPRGHNTRECLESLLGAANDGDTESAHYDADQALIRWIRSLGFDDVADAFEAVAKWYA